MRSPGSRQAFEGVLRAVAFVAMVALAIRLWLGAGSASGEAVVASPALDSALVAWSASPPSLARLDAQRLPDARQRDWLVALRRSGTAIGWTSRDSSGGAMLVEAGPLPSFPSRLTVLADSGRSIVIADELGRLDSTRAGRDGVAEWRASPIGSATVDLPSSTATAAARDSLVTKPVLVVGQAGWESKFVVSALEESGWQVATRLTIAPGAIVTQGYATRIDTASLSAVVVLDSVSALDGSAIARFVADGGGLIASGAGSRHRALTQLVGSRVSATSSGEIGGLSGPAPREGLFARTFVANSGSVALERRGSRPVVVAHRVGSGRVIAIGYDDTWRLRMIPTSDAAPDEHRMWWSSLVASAALSRPIALNPPALDEAPLASTVDLLGPPVLTHLPSPISHLQGWEIWLALIAAGALLTEWLSRRLRGVA